MPTLPHPGPCLHCQLLLLPGRRLTLPAFGAYSPCLPSCPPSYTCARPWPAAFTRHPSLLRLLSLLGTHFPGVWVSGLSSRLGQQQVRGGRVGGDRSRGISSPGPALGPFQGLSSTCTGLPSLVWGWVAPRSSYTASVFCPARPRGRGWLLPIATLCAASTSHSAS